MNMTQSMKKNKNYDASLAALLVDVTAGHQSLVGLSGQGLI